MLKVLALILPVHVLGMPFAWHKLNGCREHPRIGFSFDIRSRAVGLSQNRSDSLIGWIRRTRADGMVRVADLRAVLGRLSFAFTVLPLLRPFSGAIVFVGRCGLSVPHIQDPQVGGSYAFFHRVLPPSGLKACSGPKGFCSSARGLPRGCEGRRGGVGGCSPRAC